MTSGFEDIGAVRHFDPYGMRHEYRKKLWLGTGPLRAGRKNPPMTGTTGYQNPYPTKEQVDEWAELPKYRSGNIYIRLAGISPEHELFGIDVDHYLSGGKQKRGGDSLKKLVEMLGPLPPTWISTARIDGISGIRCFRVPRGLEWEERRAGDDIELIWKGHHYAVVWPSWYADIKRTYWWFPPETPPTLKGLSAWDGELPNPKELPLLPEPWIEHLKRQRSRTNVSLVLRDVKWDDLYDWAEETFNPGRGVMCHRMNKSFEDAKTNILEDARSHQPMRDFHWEFYHLGAEGHIGWLDAIEELEKIWYEETTGRDKRNNLNEMLQEAWRSRVEALRKTKIDVDERIKIGAAPVCPDLCSWLPPSISDVFLIGQADSPGGYEMSDDGNAHHFTELFSSEETGPVIRWIEGQGWIIWRNTNHPHWELDKTGLIRRMWVAVKERQLLYAKKLKDDIPFAKQASTAAGAINRQGNPGRDSAWAIAIAMHKLWKDFALKSGNNRNAVAAIDRAKEVEHVTIDINDVDSNPMTMGVENGVLELRENGSVLGEAEPDDLITLNTGVGYIKWDEISDNDEGKRLWVNYLEKFLPDESYRRDVQIILGHCLFGGNPHKKLIILYGVPNTGKSVITSMILASLGDYAKSGDETLLQHHKLNPQLAAALPKRVISMSELSGNKKDELTVSQIKRLAAASDTVTAELKGSNITVDRIPFFTLVIGTNTEPRIEGADSGLWERLCVIRFEVIEQNPDDSIAAKLRDEGKVAFLSWLVQGYDMYCASGRKLPENRYMKEAKEEFTSYLDDVSMFMREKIRKHHQMKFASLRDKWKDHPEWCVSRTSINNTFEAWWIKAGLPLNQKPSPHALTKRLRDFRIPMVNGGKMTRIGDISARFWGGIQIISDEK